MTESPARSRCSTSFVLDKFACICCMRIPKKRFAPSEKAIYDRSTPAPPKSPGQQSKEDQMLQFFTNFEKQQAEVSRRKSRFVSEFRSQLVRIPLQHRASDTKRSESFVLKHSVCNPRLKGGTHSSPERKKRKVSDWAKTRNFSFKKARDDLLKKKGGSFAEEQADRPSQFGNR